MKKLTINGIETPRCKELNEYFMMGPGITEKPGILNMIASLVCTVQSGLEKHEGIKIPFRIGDNSKVIESVLYLLNEEPKVLSTEDYEKTITEESECSDFIHTFRIKGKEITKQFYDAEQSFFYTNIPKFLVKYNFARFNEPYIFVLFSKRSEKEYTIDEKEFIKTTKL